jgi:hypothetical protein
LYRWYDKYVRLLVLYDYLHLYSISRKLDFLYYPEVGGRELL